MALAKRLKRLMCEINLRFRSKRVILIGSITLIQYVTLLKMHAITHFLMKERNLSETLNLLQGYRPICIGEKIRQGREQQDTASTNGILKMMRPLFIENVSNYLFG